MDLPADIQLHSELLGIKGGKGTLVAINPHGYYEVHCKFGDNLHKVMLPIQNTVIVFRQPVPQYVSEGDIER